MEYDPKNQTENLESILEKNLLNFQKEKEGELTPHISNEKNNKSSQNYYQENINIKNNMIKINKKPPKIIDIKKCLMNSKKNKIIKNPNKYIKNNPNKQKICNMINNKPNLKINNINYKTNTREDNHKKIINVNTAINSKSITKENKYEKYLDIFEEEKIIKRNFSNSGYNKIINSSKRPKSLSKSKQGTKIKNKIEINQFSSLLEDIKNFKKKKIIHSINMTSNPSHINSFNNSKKNKTMTVTVSNSHNNSILNNNTSFILFDAEVKEKNALMKQGKYYLKESERLSKYINEYFIKCESYPKSHYLNILMNISSNVNLIQKVKFIFINMEGK